MKTPSPERKAPQGNVEEVPRGYVTPMRKGRIWSEELNNSIQTRHLIRRANRSSFLFDSVQEQARQPRQKLISKAGQISSVTNSAFTEWRKTIQQRGPEQMVAQNAPAKKVLNLVLSSKQKSDILQLHSQQEPLEQSAYLKDKKFCFFKVEEEQKLGSLFDCQTPTADMQYCPKRKCLRKVYTCKHCGIKLGSVTSLGGHLSRNH